MFGTRWMKLSFWRWTFGDRAKYSHRGILHHSAWWFASGISGLITMNIVMFCLNEDEAGIQKARKYISLAMVVPYTLWGIQNQQLANFETSTMWKFEVSDKEKSIANWVLIFLWSFTGCCGSAAIRNLAYFIDQTSDATKTIVITFGCIEVILLLRIVVDFLFAMCIRENNRGLYSDLFGEGSAEWKFMSTNHAFDTPDGVTTSTPNGEYV